MTSKVFDTSNNQKLQKFGFRFHNAVTEKPEIQMQGEIGIHSFTVYRVLTCLFSIKTFSSA